MSVFLKACIQTNQKTRYLSFYYFTSIRNDLELELFYDYAGMLLGCQGVLKWNKAKILV
jgi:hypothetical protein